MTRDDTRRHGKARGGTARHEEARQGTRRHGKARARGHGMFPTLRTPVKPARCKRYFCTTNRNAVKPARCKRYFHITNRNAVKPARRERYFYTTNRNKRSVFLLTDHFVIDECKLCNKEWKPLAIN